MLQLQPVGTSCNLFNGTPQWLRAYGCSEFSLRVRKSLQRLLRFAWLQRLPECLLVVARLVAEAEFCDDTIRTTGALNDLSMHLFPRSEYSWDDRPGET